MFLPHFDVFCDLLIRDLTQQDGCKTQDGRMTKKMSPKTSNVQSRATFFRHSAVLSVTAVLLRKLPTESDARQYGIYLFYIITNSQLYFKIFQHNAKAGLLPRLCTKKSHLT